MRLKVASLFAPSTRMARSVLRLCRPVAPYPAGVALLLILAQCGLRAETSNSAVLTLSPEQWVWRAGDNDAWAASALDEAGWQPYSAAKLNPHEPRIWIRCHLDRETVGGLNHPAVEIGEFAAWLAWLCSSFLWARGRGQTSRY